MEKILLNNLTIVRNLAGEAISISYGYDSKFKRISNLLHQVLLILKDEMEYLESYRYNNNHNNKVFKNGIICRYWRAIAVNLVKYAISLI